MTTQGQQPANRLQVGDRVRVSVAAYNAWYTKHVSPHGTVIQADDEFTVREIYQGGELAYIHAVICETHLPTYFLERTS